MVGVPVFRRGGPCTICNLEITVHSMLTDWICEVDQRVDGRAFAARFGPQRERKVRERMKSGRPVSASYQEKLFGAFLKNATPVWGFSAIDADPSVDEVLALASRSPGPLSAFVAGHSAAQDRRGEWIKNVGLADLAERFDILAERLRDPVGKQDVDQARQVLLGSNFLSNNDWLCPSHETDMKSELREAKTWVQAITVIARLRYNSVMSFMALWDIAYSNSIFPRFESIPLFLLLAPRIRAEVQCSVDSVGDGLHLWHPKKSAKYREMIDLPPSLLLEVVAALLLYSKDRKFSDGAIQLRDMVTLFGSGITKKTEDQPKKLDRLRSGRDKLTIATFLRLIPNKEAGWELVPLLYAAHTWNILLCPPCAANERKVIIPDDVYLRFWTTHRSALTAKGYAVDGGNIPWPTYLLRSPTPIRN